jgi:ABC-2 type transport system ATP-binding protein
MELRISDLTKEYRRGKPAVESISLAMGNGVFGLLGPNGAGKTTLMRMLGTLLEPTAGTATFNSLRLGRDNQAIRRLLGYLPQDFGLYPSLTAREVLNYMATLHGLPNGHDRRRRVEAVLEQVNLQEVANQRVGGFSGGMRQRLGIGQALLNDPAVLIVDEPTAGLDPEERVRFRNLLGRLSGDRVVILSTHIVGDISSSCDDMALLDGGRVRFRGQPAQLIRSAHGHVWSTTVPPALVPSLEGTHQVIGATRRLGGVSLRILGDVGTVEGLPELKLEEPNLEDAYIWAMSQYHSGGIE